jgi:sortase A
VKKMPDRRTVDELTIEELERILIVKRREARADRMRRMAEIGRLPEQAALPHEDLAPFASDANGYGMTPAPVSQSARPFEVEPIGRRGRKKQKKRQATSRLGRLRDRALLVLEVGALVGLVAVLVVSFLNIRALNDDYAEAGSLPLTPTAEPTSLAMDILPGGHAPPEEGGSVPSHLRSLVEGEAPLTVPIPTPGPEAPTRIVIPAIEVDALVVEGDRPEQLKLGVGHYLNGIDPGERGNMVLSAHNDIYGEIFRHLDDLELGDEVIVYAGDQPYRYIITAKQIVDEDQVSVLASTTKPVTTLISCYPYMVDTHRIVVIAELQ